jgi:hypothetical protein
VVYRYTDNYRFFINTDNSILKFLIYRNIDIFRYYRYHVYICIFKRHIKLFQALIGVISEAQRRSMREGYLERDLKRVCLYVGVARCNMSFGLSKVIERKQRWITNVLEKQKLTSLDIVYLVR